MVCFCFVSGCFKEALDAVSGTIATISGYRIRFALKGLWGGVIGSSCTSLYFSVFGDGGCKNYVSIK